MEDIETWVGDAGTLLWSWLVLPVVIGLGLYFTIRLAGVQIRVIPDMFRVLRDPAPTDADGNP